MYVDKKKKLVNQLKNVPPPHIKWNTYYKGDAITY